MWVQLTAARLVTEAGKKKMYHPGDWVDIGEQTAMRLIADGLARTADPALLVTDLQGAGVVAYGADAEQVETAARALRQLLPGCAVMTSDAPKLSFARTLFWDTALPIRPELVTVGLRLLRTWDFAAVVWNYDDLASAHGSPEERGQTARLIHDLRVPVYDPRFLFVRRCKAGQDFLKVWRSERGEPKLALARSFYHLTPKPLLCPLPPTWLRAA